jgi:Dullard-like phosphatase family protein
MSRSQRHQKTAFSAQRQSLRVHSEENFPEYTPAGAGNERESEKKPLQASNRNSENVLDGSPKTPVRSSSNRPSEDERTKTPKAANWSISPEKTQGKEISVRSEKRKSLLNAFTVKAISELISKISKPEKATEKTSKQYYLDHLYNTFQAVKLIRTLPPADISQVQQKSVLFPFRPGYEHRKTIIFDLDETLVHCTERMDLADEVLKMRLPDGIFAKVGINIRPFAKQCLIEASKYFEVIVFTASHKVYADMVLDFLDPTHQFIHHRLYREHCLYARGFYIKDLRILKDRQMKNVAIVDNAAYSFAYQLDNGIPIIGWHDDPNDRELFSLIDYLKVLQQVDDVREVNRDVFRLHRFYEDYQHQYLSKPHNN